MVGRFSFLGDFMYTGMSMFLSASSVNEHKDYLSSLKCKAGIWQKDGVDIEKMSEREIFSLPFTRKEREELLSLKREIRMHELYFNSFRPSYAPSQTVKSQFGSENNFAYLLSKEAENIRIGFLCVYKDSRGCIGFCHEEKLYGRVTPVLTLDLSEHAYFRDYGFRKDKYVRGAIAHLNLSTLDDEKAK